MGRVYNKDKQKMGNDGADTQPTDMSDSSDSEPENEVNGGEGGSEKCTDPHDGKLIMQQTFAFNVDELFTMLFTNCKFNMKLRAFRSVSDYEEIPWQAHNGQKRRQMTYTLGLSVALGPKETRITETHIMNECSKPGALYSIDATSENAGIPYSDYFTVCVHYCLRRVTRTSTMLSFYGQVKYKKSTMFKSFIEKNTINSLHEFCSLLESKLNAEGEPAAPTARNSRSRGHRRSTVSSTQLPPPPPAGAPPPRPRWLLILVLVLLAANALLFWRLRHGERPASLYDLQNRLSSIQSSQTMEWSRLLEQHSARQRDQLAQWKTELHITLQQLAQTEQTLTRLLDTIKPSLESAQREAEGHIFSGEL